MDETVCSRTKLRWKWLFAFRYDGGATKVGLRKTRYSIVDDPAGFCSEFKPCSSGQDQKAVTAQSPDCQVLMNQEANHPWQ